MTTLFGSQLMTKRLFSLSRQCTKASHTGKRRIEDSEIPSYTSNDFSFRLARKISCSKPVYSFAHDVTSEVTAVSEEFERAN